jgi:dTDP-glucose 4,6-dehydratase
MRFVITGGLGFIGGNFIKLLINKKLDCDIINIDKVSYASDTHLNTELSKYKNYSFYKEDICDSKIEKIIQKDDIVVNFAAESHVDRSISSPNLFAQTNIMGVANLLDICRNKNVRKFVQISTDEVYGSLQINSNPSLETDMLAPSSPYSASKAAAEMLCLSYYKTYGLDINITRSSNNYGPHQYPEKLIPFFIKKLCNKEKVPLYGSGKNIRDWLHVEDNCEGIFTVIERGEAGEIYNIGEGNQLSNIQITVKILELLNLSTENIEYVTDRAGHDLRYDVNCDKLRNLNWQPRINFDEGLLNTVKWYLEKYNGVISK